ncbi:DNA polymerase III subunit beta [Algisphaera agarilytica]|uniref:Beta sliding clamp n=1 Tax=Algisphaera agarilytica TaxID=1385975 RepID=A0A7X0LKR5_9BACT|nr:DNA polymerase III subunit beta [Algisphaera agarilytica]MBB6430217.1 DNA polymerase-3 subunit beta [Algisphaera agarilytica]
MKVICDRGALVESLGLVAGVVVARTPKPVLTCVKLTGNNDGLVLEATDTEVSVRLSTPRVEVEEPGEALIPADKLQQITRESIDPTLTLTTEQDVAHIVGQDSKFKIFGHPPSDFPATSAFDGDPDFTINAGDLHRLVAQTLFATARENSRYAINGVLVERQGNKLAVVATDGHRLALAKGTCKATNDETRSAIVPTKALNLLLRLFDDAEQSVAVKVEDNQILFQTDDAVLVSNLVEGNFPPYADVIPKDGDKKATLATDLFISAVRRAALLTNEESKGVRMAFDAEGLTLSSRAPEMGEAEIHVPMPEYTGDAVEIGFNPAYLLDALKVIDDSQVQLELKGPNKPGVMRTGPNFLYVVMPVNLS